MPDAITNDQRILVIIHAAAIILAGSGGADTVEGAVKQANDYLYSGRRERLTRTSQPNRRQSSANLYSRMVESLRGQS
jgi:hypothetical protein